MCCGSPRLKVVLGGVEIVPETHHKALHEYVPELWGFNVLHLCNVEIDEPGYHKLTNVFHVLENCVGESYSCDCLDFALHLRCHLEGLRD